MKGNNEDFREIFMYNLDFKINFQGGNGFWKGENITSHLNFVK